MRAGRFGDDGAKASVQLAALFRWKLVVHGAAPCLEPDDPARFAERVAAARRVGDYAESHSGLPPQTVLDAPGEGGGAHSGLPPQTVFGAFAKSIPKSPNYYAKIAVFCGGLTNA